MIDGIPDTRPVITCIDCGELFFISPAKVEKCVICDGYLCKDCAASNKFTLDVATANIRTVCENCYKSIQPDSYLWLEQKLKENL